MIPKMDLHFGLEGWFVVELIDAKTQVVKRRLEFKNLITNAGLDLLGTSTSGFQPFMSVGNGYCAVGTSSTAPANGDTTLAAEVSPSSTHRTTADGASGIVTSYVTGPPDYWQFTRTYLFLEAQANGNLTELGLFTANTGGIMFTRQLLKDAGSIPTTVVKTSSDQLRVAYSLRVQPPQSPSSNSVTISAVSYTVAVDAANIGSSFHWPNFYSSNWWSGQNARALETNTLGARTGNPAGTQVGSDSTSVASYSSTNYYRDMTHIWEPGTANFATGIGSAMVMSPASNNHCFQIGFTPKFAKDNTKRLTLIVRYSWARV